MDEQAFRAYLAKVVAGSGAHITFEQAVYDFPEEKIATKLPHLDHGAWELVYHMEAALWDIIDFIDYVNYQEKEYPGGYWPKAGDPADPERWREAVESIKKGIARLQRLALDPDRDLFAPFPHSAEHNLARQIITAADHNSYHIGQLVDLRMLLAERVRDW